MLVPHHSSPSWLPPQAPTAAVDAWPGGLDRLQRARSRRIYRSGMRRPTSCPTSRGAAPPGGCIGPCAERSINCTREKDFRWVEGDLTVCSVDDRAQLRRQLCFEVRHPNATRSQTRSGVHGHGDRHRSSRRAQDAYLHLQEGPERQARLQSPSFGGRNRSGKRKRKPAWWVDGTRLIKARGAKCNRETSEGAREPSGDREGGCGDLFGGRSSSCGRKVPRIITKRPPASPVLEPLLEGQSAGQRIRVVLRDRGAPAGRPTGSAWSCKRFKDFQAFFKGEKR